jgi:hypothetical protein
MPKPKDLRLTGVRFEDAMKRILAAPAMPKKQGKKPSKKSGTK